MFGKPAYFLLSCLFSQLIPNIGYTDNNFKPKFSLQQEYVDNTTGTADESGYVTRLSPGFNYQLKGRKLNLSADYQLDFLTYKGLDQDSHENQKLNLDSTLTHIPGHWQSSANASIQQVNVSNSGVLITNPNLDSDNKQELRTLRVGTTFQNRIDRVEFSTGINVNFADYEEDSNTRGADLNLELGNRRAGDKVTWMVALDSTVDNAEDQTTQIDELQLKLFYRFNSVFETFIQSSTSWAESDQVSSSDELEDTSYLLGADWKASETIFINFGVGERGNKPNYRLDTRLKGRHATLSMLYSEVVTTNRRILLQQSEYTTVSSDLSQSLSVAPIIYKRLDLNLEINGRRSRAGINISQAQQGNGLTAADDEDIVNGSLYFSRETSARSKLTLDLFLQETKDSSSNKLKDIILGYQYQVSKYSAIDFSLRYSNQDSNEEQNKYTQKSMAVTYSISRI